MGLFLRDNFAMAHLFADGSRRWRKHVTESESESTWCGMKLKAVASAEPPSKARRFDG